MARQPLTDPFGMECVDRFVRDNGYHTVTDSLGQHLKSGIFIAAHVNAVRTAPVYRGGNRSVESWKRLVVPYRKWPVHNSPSIHQVRPSAASPGRDSFKRLRLRIMLWRLGSNASSCST